VGEQVFIWHKVAYIYNLCFVQALLCRSQTRNGLEDIPSHKGVVCRLCIMIILVQLCPMKMPFWAKNYVTILMRVWLN